MKALHDLEKRLVRELKVQDVRMESPLITVDWDSDDWASERGFRAGLAYALRVAQGKEEGDDE